MRVETGFLQVAATTGNGTTFPCAHLDGLVVYLRSSAGVSAGTIQIEEDQDGTATTWAAVGTAQAFTTANTTLAVHLDSKCYGNIRARFTVNATGGTITVTATGRRDT